MQPYRRGGVMFYGLAGNQRRSRAEPRAQTLRCIVGRDIALLLCTSHMKRGAARQFGEDAIHFDWTE